MNQALSHSNTHVRLWYAPSNEFREVHLPPGYGHS